MLTASAMPYRNMTLFCLSAATLQANPMSWTLGQRDLLEFPWRNSVLCCCRRPGGSFLFMEHVAHPLGTWDRSVQVSA
jgi:hypothetical protein